MNNPYTPPGSPVRDPPNAKRRSIIGGVLLGFFTDIAGSMFFWFIAASLFATLTGEEGMTPEQLAAALDESVAFQLISLAGGLALTAVGGYVAARFANHAEYATAFAVGVASLVFGEAALLAFPHNLPVWLRLLGDLLVVPAALIGGHYRFLETTPAPQE
jgi:hypothetical protein